MNLDQFNSMYALAFTDYDKAQLITGLFVGANGGEIPDDGSRCLREGYYVGLEWREEAEAFYEKKSNGGKRSAEYRIDILAREARASGATDH